MVKVNDKIQIKNVDSIIKKYLQNSLFENIDLMRLKILCSINEDKFYTVVDVCKPCKMCKIKIGKYWYPIKFEEIKL